MKRFALLVLLLAVHVCAIAAERPNIVLIMADDMGQGDLGVYNAKSKVPTPHMDRIARAGMRFIDAHTPSSVCTPTRYGLLTGRYAWRTRLKSGVLWGKDRILFEDGRATIASMLKQYGYTTGVVGKWHLGLGTKDDQQFDGPLDRSPKDFGFDFSYIIPSSLDIPPYLWVKDGVPQGKLTVEDPGSRREWDGGGGYWRKGMRTEDFSFHGVLPTTAEQSVQFIKRSVATEKPFFLYVPFASPHTPWVPNEQFKGKSGAGAYGDFTHETDWAIGQIMQTLQEQGVADDTLVIVTSDNGSHWPQKQINQFGHDANEGMRGMKADIWEGGHRVPFLVRWPGKIQADRVNRQTVCLTDVFATVAEIVGHELADSEGEDSFSMLYSLQGDDDDKPVRPSVVHHSLNGTFAIRKGDWKLVVDNLGSGGFSGPRDKKGEDGQPTGQLYNLSADPKETTNQFANESSIVAELTGLLNKIKQDGRSR